MCVLFICFVWLLPRYIWSVKVSLGFGHWVFCLAFLLAVNSQFLPLRSTTALHPFPNVTSPRSLGMGSYVSPIVRQHIDLSILPCGTHSPWEHRAALVYLCFRTKDLEDCKIAVLECKKMDGKN